jgi:DNA excision repair protein ERCC-4
VSGKAKPVILVDNREKQPLVFGDAVDTEVVYLPVADYSIKGMTDRVAIERKKLQELVGMCGNDRERLMTQVENLRAFPVRMLIIEGDLSSIVAHDYLSDVSPNAVIGTLLKFCVDYSVPVIFASDAKCASLWVQRLALREHKKAEAGDLSAGAPT